MPTTIDIESQRMLLGSTPVRKIYQGPNLLGTRIAELFANGEQGVWYDPSDLSTLFQDAAGTTPVTAMEQPVGLMLDKSGRGNHAVQATTTARPVVSARYNLLTQTADLSHPDWTSSGRFTYVPVAAPDGTLTAQELTSLDSPSVPTRVGLVGLATGIQFTVWLKAGTLSSPMTLVRNSTTSTNLVRLPFTGSVSNSYGTGTTQVGPAGWVKHTIRVTSGISPGDQIWLYYGWAGGMPAGQTYSVWRPDFREISDITLPEYQRVTSATDYDTASFPVYLKPDGVDDFMRTVSPINFGTSDELGLVAGVTKFNEALPAYQCVCELGTGNQDGAFSAWFPYDSTQHSRWVARGITSQSVAYDTVPGAVTAVFSGQLDYSAFQMIHKLNGLTIKAYSKAAEAATLRTDTLYLFSRAGASSRMRGRFYGLLVVGRACSEAEMNSMRQYMRNKTRAY